MREDYKDLPQNQSVSQLKDFVKRLNILPEMTVSRLKDITSGQSCPPDPTLSLHRITWPDAHKLSRSMNPIRVIEGFKFCTSGKVLRSARFEFGLGGQVYRMCSM